MWFNFYADENRGIHKQAVMISSPGASSPDQYWQRAPSSLAGAALLVNTPTAHRRSLRETREGYVVLSAVHPEAPAGWRIEMNFTTSVAVDPAYAGTLVNVALNGTSLPHY